MTGKQKKEISPEDAISGEVISAEESVEVEDQLDDADSHPDPDAFTWDEAMETDTSAETDAEDVTIESLSEQIEVLKTAAADSLDKAVRAQAELDNVRKRTARDIQNAHKYSLDKFINELLPVLDSMELGINAADTVEDVSSLREGMELTMKMFSSSLEKSGVSSVEPKNGDKFNPDQHEAVTMQEVEDAESGTIVTTLQKGYELNGRLIRPAMVIVAK
ncbi:MAG: molecular chaperone GrpE [Gammaproteobacteria bacterium]|jgi:molecular chaperone GrpE